MDGGQCSPKHNYAPLLCGLFILLVLVIFNVYIFQSSFQKYCTTTMYSRWARQLTTWNAYLSGMVLVFSTIGVKSKNVNVVRLSVSLLVFSFMMNWFVLTARWYWFKLPEHRSTPLRYIMADLWFHFCIPVVFTYFSFVTLFHSCTESVKSVHELLLGLVLFLFTIFIWYIANMGAFNADKETFPWPYPNGAGSVVKDIAEPKIEKLGLSILNILAVVAYGIFFWKATPRNHTILSHPLA